MRAGFLVLGLALLGFPLAALARDANVEYDREADFSRFGTYAFGESSMEGNPLVRERVITALERELEARGLKKVTEGADLRVVFHGSTRRSFSSGTWGYAPNPGWGSRDDATAEPRTFKLGTLVVDLLAGNTRVLVWRGVAPGALSDDPMKHEKTINAAAKKMFARFPLEVKQEPKVKEEKKEKKKE